MRRLLALLVSLGLLVAAAAVKAPSPEGDVLLVANKSGNSLYVLDATSYDVVDSLATGENPHEVAADPDGARAYVTNYGEGTISVVDVESGTEVDRWALEGIERPHGIQVSSDGERVYVTAEANQAVLELDAESGSVLRTFETGQETTHMLVLTEEGRGLFATSIGSGTASKIDLDSGRVLSHTQTGAGAEGVAIRDDEVWVTNRADDTVSILDAATARVLDTLRVEGFPIRVAFSPTGRHALISAPRAGEVAVYDAAARSLLRRLDVGSKPIGVVTDHGSRAFVASMGANSVYVIDLERLEITDTIDVGQGPDGMAYVSAE